MIWHAVVPLLWGTAARGADISDAESAMAARIELLKEDIAQIKRRLEKVRGAISYWGELGFTPDRGGGPRPRTRAPRHRPSQPVPPAAGGAWKAGCPPA
jgi:hypothetical protein